MIRHLQYTRARLAQRSERLRAAIRPETRPVDELLVSPAVDRISWDEAQALEYRPAELGERFGPLWATYWFRIRATVPAEWRGRRVELMWSSLSEATLWRDGRAVQGLNTGGAGERPDAVIAESARAGQRRAAGRARVQRHVRRARIAPAELQRCELALVDPDAWRLYFDFETLRALEARDDATRPGPGTCARSSTASATRVTRRSSPRCTSTTTRRMRTSSRRSATRTSTPPGCGRSPRRIASALRTFSSQLRYMDDYPEYRFACSQAQQYAWIKERDPDLWERIRAKVDAGQFVPVGGSWVEPDCNLPSGESLVRQFLHGQRFFEREFGRRHREFWSPDAFGYAGQLPQILREAGITRFLTQKLSWNRFNRPEHHTFVWQGDDGSEVLGHFPPADTYNSEVTVRRAREGVAAVPRPRALAHEPARLRLRRRRRRPDEGHARDAAPRARPARAAARRGRRRARSSSTRSRPSRASAPSSSASSTSSTTAASTRRRRAVKRGNRRCEQALHDAEFLAVARGGEYPRAELDRLWKLLLLQQFHDILPGSSIGEVYEDARARPRRGRGGRERALRRRRRRREHDRLRRGARSSATRLVEAPPFGAGARRRRRRRGARRRAHARERAPARDARARTARS